LEGADDGSILIARFPVLLHHAHATPLKSPIHRRTIAPIPGTRNVRHSFADTNADTNARQAAELENRTLERAGNRVPKSSLSPPEPETFRRGSGHNEHKNFSPL